MSFDFKWCNYSGIDWVLFNPRRTIVSHVQNVLKVYCNKNALLETFRDYEKSNQVELSYKAFMPQTFIINIDCP
jgi:hypothetical protein